MPLKKLQEKCKKNRENKITLHSTKSIRTSLNNNKKQINSHQRKSNVPFYMITDAMISNFNFWIHVMLNSNISLGDLAVYNWCSRTFWSSIIYEHFTPPCEHIYCRLPYGLNLNQFSLFEYDCCQVIQYFNCYLDNKKHTYSSNHISLWTTCTIRSPIQIFVSILCWIQIIVHYWSR